MAAQESSDASPAGVSDVVFLFDVDNTLLDNDQITHDLFAQLEAEFGAASRDNYRAIFEQLRSEFGYADYLGALQRYRVEHLHDARLLQMSSYLVDYPFAERLFPHALDVIARFSKWGPTVILSDGDVVFQPRKVERSGLWAAMRGRVLIYIHKEQDLDDVEQQYPARHYVLIDDKLRILAAVKKIWGGRVTTVFPKQGHYAADAATLAQYPPADITVDSIGDLLDFELDAFLPAKSPA
jgi:hypothetical protein